MMRENEKQELLEYLYHYINEYGYPPNYDEIAQAMDYRSKQTVFSRLQKMKEEGYIDFVKGSARTITLNNFRVQLVPIDEVGENLQDWVLSSSKT